MAEHLGVIVVVAALFAMLRYGPTVGAGLRERNPSAPSPVLWLVETLGWMTAFLAGAILAVATLQILPVFFFFGLSWWIDPCLGKGWLGGLVTLGPIFVLWLRRDPRRALLSH